MSVCLHAVRLLESSWMCGQKAFRLRKSLQYVGRRQPNFVRFCASKAAQNKAKLPAKREIFRLVSLAKDERWKIIGGVGLLFISSGVTLAVPFCVGKVIDIVYINKNKEEQDRRLRDLCGIFGIVFVVGGIANFGRVYLMQTAGQRIIHRLRTTLFSSILKQETHYFDRKKTGELINRLSSDTVIVGSTLTQYISNGMRSALAIVASSSMMIYVSPHLSLLGLCIVPPVAGMAIVYGKYIRNVTKDVQDRLANATQVAQERISNIRTVRAFAQEKREVKRYVDKLLSVLDKQTKEAFLKASFFGAAGLSGNMIILSVLYYGGMMMSTSQLTVGELSSFLIYAAYLGISLSGFSEFYAELMKGIGASTHLWGIIDRKPSIPIEGGFNPGKPAVGRIEFQDIVFAYPERPLSKVFSKLSMKVGAGSVTAIVGSSGSGKSTVGALLLRLYDPQSGAIFLDDNDISKLDIEWVRKNIGLVSQEPVLFSTTIKENILYGALDPSDYSESKMVECAKQANAYDFIQSFPNKFDTLVGERGLMLSGGQKQRIAIARALYKNPTILILDEATSALDSESERLVQEALERLMRGRTVLIIAHRLSTIKHADQIVVLSDGGISEVGSYSELMSVSNGIFKRLIEHQTILSAQTVSNSMQQ